MKNIWVLTACFIVIAISSTSCKKSWTCECESIQPNDTTKASFELTELRKNDARVLCEDEYQDIWGDCNLIEE